MRQFLSLDQPLDLTRKIYIPIFISVFACPLLFALYSNHTWEDWYITYRASKNLAIGNGLVFNPGERLHSFTSPLGTLIPALLNYITGNISDALVIWLFRLLNCTLLACSALLLVQIARATALASFATLILVSLFAIDARIVDFSINGMETAFMMFFLLLTIHSFSVPSERFLLKLGVAWAGLMWSRPDSFVYIFGLTLGYLLFPLPGLDQGETLPTKLKKLCLAGMIASALYCPWLLWATYYYGTPIPHTIIAKGLLTPKLHLLTLAKQLLIFPYTLFFVDDRSLLSTFLPPYFSFGGWYEWAQPLGKYLALLCALYWCVPKATPAGRMVATAVFLGHFYLTHVAAYVAPWYMPSVTLLSIVVLGQIVQQLSAIVLAYGSNAARRFPANPRNALYLCFCSLVGLSLLMTLAVAYQMKLRQEIIELGMRKPIGLWLAAHANSSRDTVFLECLGVIGFYSQLKMYDFPGMSSPEVVSARRSLNTDAYAPLINYLHPDWLVLRPFEIDNINAAAPSLLASQYQIAQIFDVRDTIDAFHYLPGRTYFQVDQTFTIFKRR